MSYLEWKVGDKLICIDDQPRLVDRFPYRATIKLSIEKGRTYTIRALVLDHEGVPGVLLEEAKSNLKPPPNGRERGFFAGRFRPVQTRTTDISTLRALLLNPFVKIGEDA